MDFTIYDQLKNYYVTHKKEQTKDHSSSGERIFPEISWEILIVQGSQYGFCWDAALYLVQSASSVSFGGRIFWEISDPTVQFHTPSTSSGEDFKCKVNFSTIYNSTCVHPPHLQLTVPGMQRPGIVHVSKKLSMVGVAKEIARAKGLPGFFSGMLPNLMKVVPSVAISYAVYENLKRSMKLDW